jgi:hypothetical protein
MISELNQPARIASLECGLVKIPYLPGAVRLQSERVRHEFHRLYGRRPARQILFSPFSRSVSRGRARSKESADAFRRRADTDWDIDLTLAKALPRNVRTTDDPLEAGDGKTPSTSGLIDLDAFGSGEFTAEWRVNCKKTVNNRRRPARQCARVSSRPFISFCHCRV